ncbi:MAG: hypothetical protein ABSF50_05425 [Burkholderiaceae bacterium]
MPEEVFQAVAGALGLPASIQTSERIARAIGDKTLLVLLDNCEHVVEAAAVMAEAILHLTPYAHVLATSREPLRADCEHVIIVPPLEVPAEGVHEREIIVRTGAVRLFLDRAIAAGLTAAFDDSTYDAIGEICRRLDGIPLALELAAARAATLGIDQVLRRLNDRFRLLSTGLRTALPRHQTLRAAIDWSYEQLNPLERQVFERISIFTGSFDTNAGVAIGTSVGESESSTLETIGDLASKSLLVPNLTGALALYRLLETLRIYARERLTESGQEQAVALSHALYFKELLLDAERKLRELNAADWVLSFGRHVTEVRAALNWAYAQPEQSLLAVELTILAIEMWGQLSLERESATWAEKVLALVPDDDNATHLRCKMKLYVSLGKNWTYGMGSRPRAKSDYSTGYELAVQMQDIDYALRATWGLIATAIAYGEYVEGLALSDRFCELAKDSRDPFDAVAGDRTRGVLLYLSNDLPQAQRFLMRSLDANDYQNMTADRLRYGVDIRSAARYTLAHVLWLRGLADQAIATMEQNVQDAEVVGHAYTICSVLGASSVPLCIFTGRLDDACRYNERLRAFAAKHGLDHWVDASEFFHGVIQVKQGRAASGLESIRAGEKRLTHLSFLPSYFIPVRANLGEALCLLGRVDEGLEAIHSCFSPENLCNRTWYVPEVLRMQGEAILKTARRDRFDEAKALFEQALSRANIQGSVSFELRAANSLAALHIKQSNHAAARDILAPIFRHFVEGFSTPDLREAVRLLGAAGIA